MSTTPSTCNLTDEPPYCPYADEPNPDDEFEWKAWFANNYYDPETPLFQSDLDWMHQCWTTTKYRYSVSLKAHDKNHQEVTEKQDHR